MRSFAPIIRLYEAALIDEADEETATPAIPAAVVLIKFLLDIPSFDMAFSLYLVIISNSPIS